MHVRTYGHGYFAQLPKSLTKTVTRTSLCNRRHSECKISVQSECVIAVGSNGEMVKKMEELLSVWHRQIEQVLTESEQVRREADDVGPRAELHYWKSRMAKFN